MPRNERPKQFTFWAHWKGGMRIGSQFAVSQQLEKSERERTLLPMRGVYEKVKGSNDWYISYFDADGRHHRERIGRHSAAVEAYVNKKREIREGRFVPPSKRKQHGPTLQELFDMRMADLKRSLSVKTYGHHESNFNHEGLAALKKKPASQILPKDVEDFLGALHEDEYGPNTIRNYRAMLSALFAYGIKHDLLVKNPVNKTLAPKPARERVRFLSEDEEKSIRAAVQKWPSRLEVDPRSACVSEREPELDLHLHSGMRSGEAYALTWDRVHLDRCIIEVPQEGKTGWRDIPVNSICRRALETLHWQSGGSEFVIPRCGKINQALADWFRKACKTAGVLNASPHTLRHTFASRLVMAGVNIRRVQEFLGHASIVMTMKYAHLSPERGQEDIERLVPSAPAVAESMPAEKRPMRKSARTLAARSAKIASVA